MTIVSRVADFARSSGDPIIIQAGPSVRPVADEMARVLGWFSIVLGVAELIAPHRLTRFLGMEGKEGLVRAYGAREIASGVTSLSTEKAAGLWSRLGGDVLDMATLLTAYRDDNSKKHNVGLGLALVAAIALVDLASAKGSAATHARGQRPSRDYSDRSGFPQGIESASGSAVRAARQWPDNLANSHSAA